MAKKATTAAKPTAPKRTPAKAKSGGTGGGTKSGSGNRTRDRKSGEGNTAADALLKLLESPLVADLLAVGATAALAALAEHRYSSRSGTARAGAKRALKGAATAAAAAMGRRIATEFDEIKKASKSRRGEEA